jgi:glycosyltransferase involved in cell wall biosynthesis
MNRPRLALVWPKPRAHRWTLGERDPDEYPDLSDGLRFLRDEGFNVAIEESCGVPLNPFANMHEFYSGLDPARAARLVARLGRYNGIICVGDATAYVPIHLMRLSGRRRPIVLIDPALSDGYPRRKKLQDYVLPRVSRVIVYGQVQQTYLQAEYGGRVTSVFLHHRADVDFYRPLDIAPVPGTVFSVGNDVSRDFDTLAAAARLCAPQGLRVLVQTTRQIDRPESLEIDRSFLSYADLRRAYASAAIVVVPLHDSRHAGGINALLEAMAMGRPIVVSGSQGILDYVTAGVTAEVVPPGDAQALAAAISSLAGDSARATRLGQAARVSVTEMCANRRYAGRLADVIRQALGANSSIAPE